MENFREHGNSEMPTSMAGQIRVMSPESNKRLGIPPSHPNNHAAFAFPQTMIGSRLLGSRNPNPNPGSSHFRSLSQPPFFSLDSLPPLNPSMFKEPSISSKRELGSDKSGSNGAWQMPSPAFTSNEAPVITDRLPPRNNAHRRATSDIPLGFSGMMHSSLQPVHLGGMGLVPSSSVKKPIHLVKRESEWSRDGKSVAEGIGERRLEGELADDLVSAYMNLDNIGSLSSGASEEKDLDSRASGSKTNGGDSSDNEVESCANVSSFNAFGSSSSSAGSRSEGIKRNANGDVMPTGGHLRSVSMDSYIGRFVFDEESLKASSSLGTRAGQQLPSESSDWSSKKLDFELARGEFSQTELRKIMDDEKLAEIASSDPKRAKRVLANRQSAARSKERKVRYISELEHKVQTLQTEATTLSAQLTILQRDSAGMTNQNHELKFRLQAMEQKAQLKDALNDAMTAEVQRLKIAAGEINGESHLSNRMNQQLSINSRMVPTQAHNIYQQQLQVHPQQLQLNPQTRQGNITGSAMFNHK